MDEEILDLTACIPSGKEFKVGNKTYTVIFNYRALKSLEKQYGTVSAALDDFSDRSNIYNNVLNFLYAALGERYRLKKTDVEEWITLSTVNILHDLIFDALLGAFGQSSDADAGEGEA